MVPRLCVHSLLRLGVLVLHVSGLLLGLQTAYDRLGMLIAVGLLFWDVVLWVQSVPVVVVSG